MMTGSDSPEDFEAFAISTTPSIPNAAIAPNYTAPQHGPRPLPLFLKMLWQQTRNDTDFRLKAFAGLHKYQTAQRVQIGRASCWERVCQYVSISVVAVSLKKKK